MHEVVAAEPVIQHHCHCMQRCKQVHVMYYLLRYYYYITVLLIKVHNIPCIYSNRYSLYILYKEKVIQHKLYFHFQAAPVLESESIQQVPQMQATVNKLHMGAAEVKAEADAVSRHLRLFFIISKFLLL